MRLDCAEHKATYREGFYIKWWYISCIKNTKKNMLTSKNINHTEIYFRVKLTLKMFSAKWDSALGGPETKPEIGGSAQGQEQTEKCPT